MKKTKFVWMILLMVILMGCYASENVPLTLPATPYGGSQLRIDGYFSKVIPQDAEDIKAGRDTFFKNFFLYETGIYRDGHATSSGREAMEKKFVDTLYFRPETSRTNWGSFRIKGDSIEIERWISPRGSRGYGCPSRYWKGVIIDEETIVFTEALVHMPINIKKGKIKTNGPYEFRDTFHFTPFHPKPDSLHINIKIPTN